MPNRETVDSWGLSLSEAASALDVSADTIRRWEKKGLIRSHRTARNHRVFGRRELERLKAKLKGGAGRPFEVLRSAPTRHTVLELFAGAGGMALGFENAGLRTRFLCEWDKHAVATLRRNRPGWKVVHGDVREIGFEGLEGTDVVAGGFPCQAFSYAGQKRGFEDTRGTLFFEFARCVQAVRPKIALAENVRGLLRHDGGRTLETMLNVLAEIGYRPGIRVLRAQFLDVPQKRERLVIVAVRKDLDLPVVFPAEQDYTFSLREALAGCPTSVGQSYSEAKTEVMAQVPPGGYWRDLPVPVQQSYMGRSYYQGGGKTGMARRLSWDEPSLTLTCSPAQKQTERCHPEETRPLSVREYARLQSFPDEWGFCGSVSSQYKQIGNAVPVNLAYHIGRALVAMLSGRAAGALAAGALVGPAEDESEEAPSPQLTLALEKAG